MSDLTPKPRKRKKRSQRASSRNGGPIEQAIQAANVVAQAGMTAYKAIQPYLKHLKKKGK